MSFFSDLKGFLDPGRTDDTARQREDLMATLLVMAWMVEARDPYTGGHLWRVSQFSQLLADQAGLPARDVSRISVGAFLHDLGKISVPDHILGKRDLLSDEEFAVIKTHPEVGWRMLSGHPLAKLAEQAIRSHHERPDGKGYPQGLLAADISVDARIVGICDAFDAMTSSRPYRQGMPIMKALEIITSKLDQQFDRELGERFVALGQQGALNHIVAHSDLGIPLQVCVKCGPIIAVPRSHLPGSPLYCPSCHTEYATDETTDTLRLSATGRLGSAAQLAPQVDAFVIADAVHTAARALQAQLQDG